VNYKGLFGRFWDFLWISNLFLYEKTCELGSQGCEPLEPSIYHRPRTGLGGDLAGACLAWRCGSSMVAMRGGRGRAKHESLRRALGGDREVVNLAIDGIEDRRRTDFGVPALWGTI
jgi:hypothetical protein